MIKVGDKFYADGVEWEVTDRNDISYSIKLHSKRGVIDISNYISEEFRVFTWQAITEHEMKMCLEIIEKLKGESK